MDTYFAPAQRTERRQLKNQILDTSSSPVMNALLETSEGILVVLNDDRQIVALNHAFLDSLGVRDAHEVLGLRLGESLSCIHAFSDPSGCGTTEHCVSCGAAIAMMSAINNDKETEQVCALVSDKNGIISDICLQVKAKPIHVDGNRWILFFAHDVTQQQFWLNMDRVFFHDINNTLTALYGNVQLLEMDHPGNFDVASIRQTVERLVSEVEIQKDLSHHRDAAYKAVKTAVPLSRIKEDLDAVISGHKSSDGKTIISAWPEQDAVLETDPLLISRILGNMVINALEATEAGGSVRISAGLTPDQSAVFTVWNQAYIPAHIQKRIFQRYFSSKEDQGRGLGTYSMKLFGESYLKGKVTFTSTKEDGTLFVFNLPL
ncbi:MAG: PAS domain-containing sensor histidine kinase [Desulfobacterales bacterium]|nr:PAS domain-containing sensor histidine kinase [Desulfobacterales bacterium]